MFKNLRLHRSAAAFRRRSSTRNLFHKQGQASSNHRIIRRRVNRHWFAIYAASHVITIYAAVPVKTCTTTISSSIRSTQSRVLPNGPLQWTTSFSARANGVPKPSVLCVSAGACTTSICTSRCTSLCSTTERASSHFNRKHPEPRYDHFAINQR